MRKNIKNLVARISWLRWRRRCRRTHLTGAITYTRSDHTFNSLHLLFTNSFISRFSAFNLISSRIAIMNCIPVSRDTISGTSPPDGRHRNIPQTLRPNSFGEPSEKVCRYSGDLNPVKITFSAVILSFTPTAPSSSLTRKIYHLIITFSANLNPTVIIKGLPYSAETENHNPCSSFTTSWRTAVSSRFRADYLDKSKPARWATRLMHL